MGPPRHLPAPGASSILLLWLSALSLFLCSPSQAADASTSSPPPAPGGCSREEASSLLGLFHGFNITADLPSWKPGTDCCTWEGITCGRATGRVVALSLGEKHLLADVNASSLLGLPHLSSIDLSWNNLNYSSSFPSVLAGLPNLTHLNISMKGTFLLEFPRLTSLVSLQLSASPPAYDLKLVNGDLGTLVGNLPGLRELRLDSTDLSNVNNGWCQALSSALPRLRVLSLRRCSLSGTIGTCLSQLSFLSEIYLDYNDFPSGLPSFTSNFSSLRFLSLPGCGLTGRLPENLVRLPKLEILDLSSNPLTGPLPEFPLTSALQILSLTSTGLSGGLPSSIGYLRSLRELVLGGCNFTGQIPDSIANLSHLSSLDLSGNKFSGRIPPALGSLTLLVKINLADNSLSGQIPTALLSSSQKLETFLFQNNQLTGPIPPPRPEMLSNLNMLNLQNNSLNGSIPSSLFPLPSLQHLLLNNNRFSGQLREFPNASSSLLEQIDLSNNELQGQIPISIFKLPRLGTLTLSFNKFNGTLELGLLQNMSMSHLDLSYNLLSVLSKPSDANSIFPSFQTLRLASCNLSSFPDFLRGLYQSVYHLDLSNNRIRGEIPIWIWQVMDGPIIALNLSNNLLEGFERPLPDILQYKNFDTLDLHSNLLQGPLVLPGNAAVLDYSDNRFTSNLPRNMGPLFSGLLVSLSGNNLSGEIPLSICNASRLEVLDLSNNSFSGSIPPCLVNTSTLSVLNLRGNRFGGINLSVEIPPSICNASGLQVLDLSDNNFSGWIPSCLVNSSTLSVLNLRGNRFVGILPQNFGDQCSLSTMDVSENLLQGQLPRSLANCRQLEVLNLRQNYLVDTFPFWLGDLPLLRVLILRSNGFHGRVRCDGTRGDTFQSIQILDLSSNGFVGELPSDCFDHFKEMMVQREKNKIDNIHHGSLGGWTYYQDSVKITMKGEEVEIKKILNILVTIDLSGNRFEGGIPSSMGKLKYLVLLNISRNSLVGSIPPALGDLASLESLDLSRNMLSGRIPDQLTRLTFLSILNLSHNRLYGSIPQRSQFLTFSNSSYEGNAGLCGPPLSRRCGADDGGGEGRPPAGPPAASTSRIDWGSEKIGFGLGAGMGVSLCTTVFWWKGFFDAHEGRMRRQR